MAVNMQTLSASISTAVQQAVVEAFRAQLPAAPSQDTQSTTDQSVANVVSASWATITQGTPPPNKNAVIFAEPVLDSRAPQQTHCVKAGISTVAAPASNTRKGESA